MNPNLSSNIRDIFVDTFKRSPVAMAFAPGRINIIGEHTDYNGGFVFPAAIDKGIVCAVAQNELGKTCRVLARDPNEYFEFALNSIKPIWNGGWRNYIMGLVLQLKKRKKTISGFDLVFGGDLPIGAGLSSSAALENSVLMALNSVFALKLKKKTIIKLAVQAEHTFVGVACGIMDQYASMFGKKNQAFMLNCNNTEATHTRIDLKDHAFVLMHSQVHHKHTDSFYNERRRLCERIATKLGVDSLGQLRKSKLYAKRSKLSPDEFRKARFVVMENERVWMAFRALKTDNIANLGALLYASHSGLQHEYQVSCREIDFLVTAARRSRVVTGARIMGGGFGGCTLNLVRKNSLHKLEEIAASYKKKFSLTPEIIPVKLAAGARVL